MLRKIIPHATIVLCNMYVVFYLIDRVNPAMEFITNEITKFLILLMCILSTVNAALIIYDQRRRRKMMNNRRRPAPPVNAYRRPERDSYAQNRYYNKNERRSRYN